MEYRSYIIEPSSWPGFNYDYYPSDYDGQPVHTAKTIEEAKREIDIKIFESQVWKVKVVPHTEPVRFDWLSDAMKFISKHTSAVPLFEFNAP